MKMILSSAFSSAILLFGLSLIYAIAGTLDFKIIAASMNGGTIQILAFILIFSGFAFKLSAVPFHLWTADVYEGSPIAVTAFLSVVSKGAMAFVFITALYSLFGSMTSLWYYMLAFTAVITMVVGNLFALRQTNMKRFLAFSSIAQVGYLLIGISGANQLGIASVVYFVLIYMFSNLAAFGVLSIVSAKTGNESIASFKGLYYSNPKLALVLALGLFSLAGVPPTAGFFGKLFLLTSGAQSANWVLLTIASLNLVISLYYYLNIVRLMFTDSADHLPLLQWSRSGIFSLLLCAVGIISVGFLKGLFEMIYNLSHLV